MADIFYFTSPRKPIAVPRYRPSARRTPKVIRKRRTANAEMFDQRACVAHCEEPTFCPSDTSSIFLPRPNLHSVHASTRDTPLHFDLQHDHDMDDMDESGGVPLPTSQRHMTNDFHDINLPDVPMHIFHDQDTQHDIIDHANLIHDSSILSTLPSPTTARPRRRSHTRPQARDSSAEEESRRTRFALAGSISDELSQPTNEAVTSRSLHHTSLSERNGNSAPNPVVSAQPVSQLTARPTLQAMHPPTARELEAARLVTDIEHAHAMDIDEDALAVDDPRRHYDVAEFMDIWRLHSLANKRLPPFEPGIQPSIRLGRPPEQVTRGQVKSGAVDMQGVRWQMIGPLREDAFIARSMLHPSSSGSGYSRSQEQYRPSGIAGDSERHYRFRAFVPRHRACFEHYQLRNVLAATDRNNIFYGTSSNRVIRASLSCPTSQETVMNLGKPSNTAAGFRITCLSASPRSTAPGYRSDNVLIAGGFYGEYAVVNVDLDQQRPSEGFVTHAYNGLVTHVQTYHDRRSGLLRAAFCSNDHQVRLMDLHNLQFTDTFTYDNAVNCSATSADGRLRVLVGDSTETLITDAERGVPLVTLKEHTDHAFGCAWSPNGRHVATAAQDGCVVIWDARNWKQPLRTHESVMSCARSLNFTDTGALVAAENEDVVTVYDGPNFDDKQEIRFFGSIAGVALLDGGAELAIANADKTVGGLLTFERQPQSISYTPVVAKADSPRRRNGKSMHGIEVLV